jgi:hypothetical protein
MIHDDCSSKMGRVTTIRDEIFQISELHTVNTMYVNHDVKSWYFKQGTSVFGSSSRKQGKEKKRYICNVLFEYHS